MKNHSDFSYSRDVFEFANENFIDKPVQRLLFIPIAFVIVAYFKFDEWVMVWFYKFKVNRILKNGGWKRIKQDKKLNEINIYQLNCPYCGKIHKDFYYSRL